MERKGLDEQYVGTLKDIRLLQTYQPKALPKFDKGLSIYDLTIATSHGQVSRPFFSDIFDAQMLETDLFKDKFLKGRPVQFRERGISMVTQTLSLGRIVKESVPMNMRYYAALCSRYNALRNLSNIR